MPSHGFESPIQEAALPLSPARAGLQKVNLRAEQPLPSLQQQVIEPMREEPQVQEQIPQIQEPLPQVQEPIPQVQEPLPQVQEPLPQVQEPIPQVQEPLPQIQEPLPQVQEPLPQVQEPLPQVQEPIPQVQEQIQVQEELPPPPARGEVKGSPVQEPIIQVSWMAMRNGTDSTALL